MEALTDCMKRGRKKPICKKAEIENIFDGFVRRGRSYSGKPQLLPSCLPSVFRLIVRLTAKLYFISLMFPLHELVKEIPSKIGFKH